MLPSDCLPQAPSGVDQEICECSGGTWSGCASPCPTTCDNLGDLIACPTVCVTGCICPPGFVLDPVFGCKEESFCEIPFCCLALTAPCLACAEAVPVELFCALNSNTLGCDDVDKCTLPFDPCSVVDCESVSRLQIEDTTTLLLQACGWP